MSCLRCEIARAKIIDISLGGLRRPLQDILYELTSRYGSVYRLDGRQIKRNTPTGDVVIYEVRR